MRAGWWFLLAVGFALAACAADDTRVGYATEAEREAQPVVAEPSGVTRRVPNDHDTIQAAVDTADPGDLILISPGVYREQVDVATPSLVIRGTDRNRVIVDGEFERANGFNITANGIAVENLTVRNARLNGLFWKGVTGYRASAVTSVNNEVYGIYAFDSVDGMFEDSYASGSADAGFYIGQCNPCHAVIRGVTAERNGLGYSGTNASGNLHIVESVWRHNIAGIVPNTLDTELLPPVERVDVVGNLVYANGNREAPTLEIEWPSFGAGIIVAGGNDLRVERNRVLNNALHGVLVTPNLSDHLWIASGNVVRDNRISGSGRADLALAGPAGPENCFAGNDAGRTVPVGLEVFQACDGLRLPWRWDLSTVSNNLGYVAEATRGLAPDNPPREQPAPPPQPQLEEGPGAPVVPAVDVYESVGLGLASVSMPAVPDGLEPSPTQEVLVSGLPLLATGLWSVFFGLYAYLLPFVLLAAWTALALWDLVGRDLSRAVTIVWIAVILLVPFLGVILYLAVGARKIPGWLRAVLLAGGFGAYVIILAAGSFFGGII